MSQKFYTLITQQGAALLANATTLGIPLKLSKMAVGDANGSATTPDASQTKLIHEVYKAPLNTLTTDEKNPNQIIAELVIPENQGGWFINEIGLYDEDDTLVAVGNCPTTYKPQLSEGSGRTQVIRMIFVVDNVNAVTLKIDPSIVLATRQYVEDLITSKMANHEQTTNHPSATTNSKGFVQLNSAIDSNLENQAATPLAVKKAYNMAADAIKKANDLISTHEKSTNHPNATTNSKGFVQLNSSIDSTIENQAA
ncbi:phage tail protein, partial [Gilliamella apicola]